MNEMHNYSINKQRAIDEMLDMNKRATKSSSHTQKQHDISPASQQSRRTSAPFMQMPLDSDTLTIAALMIILYNDGADMLLIFALMYILF